MRRKLFFCFKKFENSFVKSAHQNKNLAKSSFLFMCFNCDFFAGGGGDILTLRYKFIFPNQHKIRNSLPSNMSYFKKKIFISQKGHFSNFWTQKRFW